MKIRSFAVRAISLIPEEVPLARVWDALDAVFVALKSRANSVGAPLFLPICDEIQVEAPICLTYASI